MNIHLGCWHRNIPGFINVDLCDMPHIHYKSSIDKLPMFEDNCADLIYSSHSLEYFDRVQVADVLSEWNRVLKVGGILRLAVPDFDKLLEVYKKTGDITKILGPLYGRMEITSVNNEKMCLYHKTVYNLIHCPKYWQMRDSAIFANMIGEKRSIRITMIILKHIFLIWIKKTAY